MQQQHSAGPPQTAESSAPLAPNEIGHRINRLEREVRLYRFALVPALGVCLFAMLTGASGTQKAPDEIRARRFTVVDDQGQIRGHWGHSGTSTCFSIGSDGEGIRMEHGAHTNAIQLITPARNKPDSEGFQTNSLTLHNDPYNTGVLIVNPGTREDGNSRGRVWLSTLKGCELSRKMFDDPSQR